MFASFQRISVTSVLLLVAGSAIARAQCAPGWIGAVITVTMPVACNGGIPTLMNVYVCWPDPAGPVWPKEQYQITSVSFPNGPWGCELSAGEMRTLGGIVISMNPANLPCGPDCNPWCDEHPECPCPSLRPQWNVSFASCWMATNQGEPSWVPCVNPVGICIDYYNVCCEVHVDPVTGDTTRTLKKYLVGAEGQTFCEGDAASNPACRIICPGPLPTGELPPCEEDPAAREPQDHDLSEQR